MRGSDGNFRGEETRKLKRDSLISQQLQSFFAFHAGNMNQTEQGL
jgi:hypothetical protein